MTDRRRQTQGLQNIHHADTWVVHNSCWLSNLHIVIGRQMHNKKRRQAATGINERENKSEILPVTAVVKAVAAVTISNSNWPCLL